MACFNSIHIEATADRIWTTLRNFHDLGWAASIVQQCEAVGPARSAEPGAARRLNEAITETLVALDDIEYRLAYRIENDSTLRDGMRVHDCISEVRVIPVTTDETSVVTWASRWDAAKGDVQGFLDTVYQALLTDLRSHCARAQNS